MIMHLISENILQKSHTRDHHNMFNVSVQLILPYVPVTTVTPK